MVRFQRLTSPLLSPALMVFGVALACGVVGFVYAHEPARDQVVVDVDHTRPASPVTMVSGTVVRIGDGRVVVEGERGAIDLAMTADASVEELQTIPPSALVAGARVNVGAERSNYGVALTGVVVVGDR